MRPRHLIRADMIEVIGRLEVARRFNVTESTTYKWGEDPERSGRQPSEEVTDYLLAHPKARPFRVEYLSTFGQPVDLVIAERSALKRMKEDFCQLFDAIEQGRAA